MLATEFVSQNALQMLDAEEATVHWRTWVLEKLQVLLEPAEPTHRTRKQKPFSSAVFLWCPLLTAFNMMLAGIETFLKGPYPFSQSRQKGLIKSKCGKIQRLKWCLQDLLFPYSSLLLSLCWLHSNLAASMLWYNYFSSKRVFLLGIVTNIPLLSLLTLTPVSLMSAACHPKISVAGGCDVFKPYRALCFPTLSLIRVLLLVEVTWCWTDPNNFELIGALWLESKMAEFIACLKKCVLCPFELLYFLKNHFYKGAEFE